MLQKEITDAANIQEFQESIDAAAEYVESSKTSEYDPETDVTTTTITIEKLREPDKRISVIEYIPKEMASSVDELEFSVPPSQIINDDPMIMWHIDHIDQVIDNQHWLLKYMIKGESNLTGTSAAILWDVTPIDFGSGNPMGTVADIDGNIYRTIKFDKFEWMAENLRTTRYADGTPIPEVTGLDNWDALEPDDAAWCNYHNSNANRNIYGSLYTWAAATRYSTGSKEYPSGIQGACPDGWHIPSDSEWVILELYLDMSNKETYTEGYRGTYQGGILKESGTGHWLDPNTESGNDIRFTALPAGVRTVHGNFHGMNETTVFWTTTLYSSTRAWHRSLYYDKGTIRRNDGYMQNGYSVRCVKDYTLDY